MGISAKIKVHPCEETTTTAKKGKEIPKLIEVNVNNTRKKSIDECILFQHSFDPSMVRSHSISYINRESPTVFCVLKNKTSNEYVMC